MKKPNVILVMTDDQGYGDLSVMGSKDVMTPNIDELANKGVRFTNMYSNSPVCSPSRASLLTGRYPGNAGVRSILAGHRKATGLTNKVDSIASALKREGYNTGIIGKWHLGLDDGCRPNDNGFDYFYGFMAGCIDYYSHIFYWGMADGKTNPCHDLWENEKEIYENGKYFTDLVSEKSVEFIETKAESDEPFLLYVAYNAPHYPMHAPEKYMNRFKHLPWDRQVMAAMLSAVDDGISDIISALKRKGIYEDTIIYYQSDNGPSRESRNWLDGREDYYYGGEAGILKGHKFSLFEGGIRVPGIISWPGKIKPSVIDEAVVSMDIFPTILNCVGGDCNTYNLDGKDIMNVINGTEATPHEMIFWEMENQLAVRYKNYKLVLNGSLVEGEAANEPVFLSDLSIDPSERNNIANELPELTAMLTKACEEWFANIENNFKKNR